ncbi:hypothetical protein ACFL0W_04825 [Nanoarchaeota archaeon]
MTDAEILKETPITMTELKAEFAKIKKREEDLNFRAGKTEDFLNSFDILKPKDAKELAEKIKAVDIARMKDEQIIKLVDILPGTPEEVKLVLQGYNLSVTPENLTKIANLVKEYKKVKI